MNTVKCYVTPDGHTVATFCELGVAVAEGRDLTPFNRAGNRPPVCCNSMGCACHADILPGEKLARATEDSENSFWFAMRQEAEKGLYEAQYDL